MKVKIYLLFFIGILIFTLPASGQKTVVVVEPDAGLDIGALNTAIAAAETAGTAANTIFELKRDGLYLLNGDIAHTGYTLHIRGQEGAGSKPVLQAAVDLLGVSDRLFTNSGDLILEHLYLLGADELGAIMTQQIRVMTDASRVIINDCVFDYSGQSFVRTNSKNNKIYIKNSVLRNSLLPDNPSNGRVIDARGNANDTLWVSNSTIYNNGATQIRSDGGATNFANWDHNTVYQTSFAHRFALDYIFKANVTNNIFYNFLYRGDNTDHSAFFTCDSIFGTGFTYTDANRYFDLSNNNWFIQKEIGDILDQYGPDTLYRFNESDILHQDTIRYREAMRKNWFIASDSLIALGQPGPTPDIVKFIQNGQVDTANLFKEELVFKNPPPLNLDYWRFYTEHGWAITGMNPPNAYADEDILVLGEVQTGAFDFSYNADSRSATAAEDGSPLGASRWVPYASVGIRDVKTDQRNGVRTYPNPFENQVSFKIDSKKASKITIRVFDLMGKELYTEKGNVTQGENEITVNLDKLSHRGLFLYKIQFESPDGMKSISSGKLLKK
jgi:hypothetical protein